MYYVSYIQEFPIYEPAEGGYFYAGEDVVWCNAYPTWKKAKRAYRKAQRDFMERFCPWAGDNVRSVEFGGCNRWGEGSFTKYYDRSYIGQDEWVWITRFKPVRRGYEPYC